MNKFIILTIMALTVSGSMLITSCDVLKNCNTVDVSSLQLSAMREPETFDSKVPTLQVEEGAVECLRKKSKEAADASNEKLLECSSILTGSPPWIECHEEREIIQTVSIFLNDIANAIEGSTRFDRSPSGTAFIQQKLVLGPSVYETYVDLAQEVVPVTECEICD